MADRFPFTLEGDETLRRFLQTAKKETPLAVAQAVWEEANLIFAKSQRIVPVDTGVLRGSGGVSSPQSMSGGGTYVDIFYGGPAAPYALYVHEIIENYHKAPTQAKYLEQPFMESLNTLQRNIARRIIRIANARS
jgi:hypothetical protein